jgi:two-component sensor histidine kinase
VRLKQSEQLQVQFETAQRDHENLLLRNKNNLQQSELEKEILSRKLTIIALLGSVLVIGLMLYLYRAKQKSNTMLQSRQNEINKQNNLLNELLQEKEWLMKEIHHRVKNNLQIISSLLNTQSSYLDNEQAVIAIRDSQNRMQAISIVHQKLYQSEDLSTINLQKYIEELARSIQDSFHDKRNVKFVF